MTDELYEYVASLTDNDQEFLEFFMAQRDFFSSVVGRNQKASILFFHSSFLAGRICGIQETIEKFLGV